MKNKLLHLGTLFGLIAGIMMSFGSPALATSHVSLQLFTVEGNAQQVTEFPFEKRYAVTLLSESEDLTRHLPITIELRNARVHAFDRIPNEPDKYCKDTHLCAVLGPIVGKKGDDTAIEITARSSSGDVLAQFKQGEVPPASAAAETNPTTTSASATSGLPGGAEGTLRTLPSTPSTILWKDPYFLTLLGLAVLAAAGTAWSFRKARA